MREDPSPVEDGRSQVAGPKGRAVRTGAKFGIMALVGVLALALIWFNAIYGRRITPAPATTYTAEDLTGQQYIPPPPAPTASTAPPPAAPPPPVYETPSLAPTADAPILAYSGSATISPQVPEAGPASNTAEAASNTGANANTGPDVTPLAAKLTPTTLNGEQASLIRNPDMVITQGAIIPCVLQTAIDSQLPGLVTCIVPVDIRGTTGNVVLLDRGTKIVGQVQNGLMQGQNRVFILWTRAETPEHVIVTLDSPGADELGRSGVAGKIDDQFWQKFGGALLLTVVQGALEAATAEAASGGGNSAGIGFIYSTQSSGSSVAATSMQGTTTIAPTLSKNQGDVVSLVVARDLDFSNVYSLRLNNMGTGNGG